MALDTMNQLGQMQKVPLDMTLDGLAALRQTQQADNIGLQEMMRKQAQAQQMDPLLVQEQQLRNRGLTLDHQKQGFELGALGRKDKMETELWDQTKATNLSKLLDEEGTAKANIFGNQLLERLQKTRPGTPEHRAIMGALQTTKGWIEKQRDHGYKMQEVGAQIKGQKDLMQMQIDAGRFTKPDKSNILVRLRSAKTSLEKAEILEQAYYEAVKSQDPSAQEYAQRALEARQRAAEEARNRGLATPSINVPEVAGLPANPAPSATAPIAGTGAKANKTKSGVSYTIVNE